MGKHKHHTHHKGHSGHRRGAAAGGASSQSLRTQDRQEDTRRTLGGSCHDEWAATVTGRGRTFEVGSAVVQTTGESFAVFAYVLGIFGIEKLMKKANMLTRVKWPQNAIGLTPVRMCTYLEAVLMCRFCFGPPGLTWTELLNLCGNELEWTEYMESKIPKAPASKT